jgi:hypothetical protein
LSSNSKAKPKEMENLSPAWVACCFHPKFLAFLRQQVLEGQNPGIACKDQLWINITVGNATFDPQNVNLDPSLVCEGVAVKYQQYKLNTCVFKSAASAFHWLGRKETGNILQSIAATTTHWSSVKQLEELMKVVKA